MNTNNLDAVHRRKNILSGDWVLVSPHRNNRPWHGAVEASAENDLPSYVSSCPLCPNNARANENKNPNYEFTHVFTNDFSALQSSNVGEEVIEQPSALFHSEKTQGVCRVVIFSPNHNQTLPEMTQKQIYHVVQTWVDEFTELSKTFSWVQIFENKGELMGCSQPHPHGQVWAHDHIPSIVQNEDENQLAYFTQHQRPLLLDYALKESLDGQRTVAENKDWIAVVPYWAAWPFETLLLPKFAITQINQLTPTQQERLAEIIQTLTIKYDNLFNCSFPYSMGWHGAPSNQTDAGHWQLHAHFFPPLLRNANVKKHMVGYEMMAEGQRDLPAEKAAEILKDTSDVHYKARG
jgi:UDPglucose--hexose-1-phosphate uridylyltransferase